MPLVIVPMAFEVLSVFVIWGVCDFGLLEQIILTAAIIGKFALYFTGALVIGEDGTIKQKLFLILCGLINAGIIAYSIITSNWELAVNNIICLVLLVVWSCATVFDFSRKRGPKE